MLIDSMTNPATPAKRWVYVVGRKKIASVLTAWPSLAAPTPQEEEGGWVAVG